MSERATRVWRLALAVVVAGVAVGLMAGLLNELLRLIETLAFGAPDDVAHEGATLASGGRRMASLAVVGVLGAVAWFALRRWGRRIVSVEAAVGLPLGDTSVAPTRDEAADAVAATGDEAADGALAGGDSADVSPVTGERMPLAETVGNALTQLAVVGGGASVGREAAPRELGALIGQWSARTVGLAPRESRLLVAAAAGAGLAGVYGVPFAGALFAVEVLLFGAGVSPRSRFRGVSGARSPRKRDLGEVWVALGVALATSVIAAGVAWLLDPHGTLYAMPRLGWSTALVLLAVPLGAAGGLLGRLFARAAEAAGRRRPDGVRLLWLMPAVFVGLGLVSWQLPQLLGNGRSAVQFAFDVVPAAGWGSLTLAIALVLLVLKFAATVATIGSGAAGGTLTPSLAVGAMLGLGAGALWQSAQPDAPLAACALLGAGAVLAASTRAPFMAFALAAELTHTSWAALVPLAVAVAASWAVTRLLRPAPAVEDIA